MIVINLGIVLIVEAGKTIRTAAAVPANIIKSAPLLPFNIIFYC